jgi:hypothetical protein
MSTTYIGSWMIVALVIALKFLVNSHLFVLEVIRENNLGLSHSKPTWGSRKSFFLQWQHQVYPPY